MTTCLQRCHFSSSIYCSSSRNTPSHASCSTQLPTLGARPQLSNGLVRSSNTLNARSSTKRRAAAVAAAPPASTEAAPTQGWWTKNCPPNMIDIHTIQELVDALSDNQDKLVIVDFYAPWCNACRALFPKLCKLVAVQSEVVVLKVNFEENKSVCKSLGIKVLPFFHFYKGAEGRVEAFSCSVSKIQRLKDALELHGGGFCSLLPVEKLEEFPEVLAHPERMNSMPQE